MFVKCLERPLHIWIHSQIEYFYCVKAKAIVKVLCHFYINRFHSWVDVKCIVLIRMSV